MKYLLSTLFAASLMLGIGIGQNSGQITEVEQIKNAKGATSKPIQEPVIDKFK